MFDAETIKNFVTGLEITLYGLGGVFAVLLLFYLLVRLMMKLAGRIPDKEENSD